MAALHSGLHRRGQGVYGISVAAELSGVLAPTLRLYEQHGLLFPARSNGGTRRYSDDDLDRVHRISELTDAGINLAGIAHILQLQHHNTQLATDNAQLRAQEDTRKGESPMISDPTAPTPEGVPEADYRDQHLPTEDDPADVDGELFPPEISSPFDADADDGDRLDQARSAPLGEDAHPEHES